MCGDKATAVEPLTHLKTHTLSPKYKWKTVYAGLIVLFELHRVLSESEAESCDDACGVT